MTLPEELITGAHRTLRDVRAARLDPDAWSAMVVPLDQLATGAAKQDPEATGAAQVALARLMFEAKIRRTMPGTGRAAPGVAPTKRTSALPIVGLVCAALLMAVGFAAGGTLVLAGTAAFSLFILAVALAGSHVVARRRRPAAAAPETRTTSAPSEVKAALDRAEAALDHAQAGNCGG